MAIGVKALKAKLSSYLQRVAAGEVITVTHRGRPVVAPGPPAGAVDLEAAVEAGWVTPSSRTGLRPVGRHRARGTVLQTLAEDRGE